MDKYIGKMLDNRYEILEIMGIGGMAYVYKARCHLLNRLVAVKILKEEYASDADFRRRFHAESQAVAMLGHPNIVAVYDVSRSAELEYIVMELIDGITLKQYMQKKGLLNWREALHFVIQIVKALSHAHSRGIIHRDIKPHNIMILRDGSVKVADFGIARFASKQNTLTQEALGSVHYISPEQARGSHIDARSDLYSVGVVLYEMLTERLPFEGDSPVSVALQHINSLPLSPREVNSEIPEALEMIIIKAMAPKLTQRYASAEDMLRDLEEFRKNPSISFEYDVSELKTPSDGQIDEPTRSLPGGGARSTGVKLDPKREEEERKRIRKEMIAEENHKTRKTSNLIAMLCAVLGVLGLVAVLGFAIYFLIGDVLSDKNTIQIEVPDFIGKDYTDEFKDSLLNEEYRSLTINAPVYEYHDVHPKDRIIDQDPPSGMRGLQEGDKIAVTLTVSLGREEITLRDLARMNKAEARSWIVEQGLRYAEKREQSETIPRDSVIRTEPGADATVFKDDLITVIVSSGKEIIEVPMPDLLTHPVYEEEAANTLSNYNLAYEFIHVSSNEPKGLVLSQSVEAGEMVPEETVIYLEISEGPPEVSPSPEDPTPSPSELVSPDPGVDPSPGVESPPPVEESPPDGESPPPIEESPPVTPDIQPTTKTRDINFPPDAVGMVHVQVYLNGELVFDQMCNADDPNSLPSVTITGFPEDIVKVHFDGEEYYSHVFGDL